MFKINKKIHFKKYLNKKKDLETNKNKKKVY